MRYPFIYIAALMRTGSTVLSEALTRIPYSFIFREPHIGKNTFHPKQTDIELFSAHGVDLTGFLQFRRLVAFGLRRLRFLGAPQDYMARELKIRLIPQMQEIAMQVGVKEIDNRGWRNYLRQFPAMKVILTGRDPRDIYLSAYYKWKRGTLPHYNILTPANIARDLNEQFQIQLLLSRNTDCMKVRYEDLCRETNTLEQIKTFLGSPLQEIGQVGQFNAREASRRDEAALHGEKITSQQVGHWQREKDPELAAQTQSVFDLMPEYTGYWGYNK